MTLGRAERLIEQASRSVASHAGPATERPVRELARQVRHLQELITKQEELLSEELELPEEVALLKSYGSVGDYSAVGMLLQIQTVERFASAKKMAAFFGIHPVFKQSGDGLGQMRMSKQGSSEMRSLLFWITMSAIQDHPTIAPLYKRLALEEGKEPMVAIGACMHKTLRIFYGILKHRKPFDPEVERRHRERSEPAPPTATEPAASALKHTRRYQAYDSAAPISDRAKKRRRSQAGSQGAVGSECRMSSSTTASVSQRGESRTGSVKEQPTAA